MIINFKKQLTKITGQRGYTIIELIITLIVLLLIFPITSSIVISVLRYQDRLNKIAILRIEGQNIINFVRSHIRERTYWVYSNDPRSPPDTVECAASPSFYSSSNGYDIATSKPDFYFVTENELNWFTIFLRDGRNLEFETEIANPIIVNSQRVAVTSFSIYCIRKKNFSSPVVSYDFTLQVADLIPGVNPAKQTFIFHDKFKLQIN
ncbi:hypothetical protein A2966_03710 [Candidatus Roizmanbacteria bacterium RIFCSPLOWO2_01_FULL_41_22]|uniref:Type II secretion system protein n=1 Tax=Candidatus Roizmanbacteria bacterium RIFCSPLOWO2_01_FULL_41_22 TaxID=1802067 RepID=A0A1F7J8Z0_9BACT|nr:MAG: hypothetical protein A2966_03710 [Candidatus Roizmanbacteria bacterium RIFCSPLOWO2_01_FULL_41_22]